MQDLEDNGWVQVAETTETVLDGEVGPVEATAIATTVRYDDRGLAGQIQDTPVTVEYRGQTTTGTLCDYFDDGFDQSLSVFAATKIDLSPHIDELPGGIGRAEVMEPVETQAQSQFERQLGDAGLKNVTRVSTGTIEVASGLKASLFEYRASFPLERTRVSVLDGTIDVPADEIEIAGYLAIWHDGRNVLIGAGAHPNENHQDTVTDAVQGSEVTVSYDIDLSPARLRQEVLGYLRRIE